MKQKRFSVKIDEKDDSSFNFNNMNIDVENGKNIELKNTITLNKKGKNINLLSVNYDEPTKEIEKNTSEEKIKIIEEIFNEKERILIKNHSDSLILHLFNYMEGINISSDLSYNW